jgi:hypothetical protein
MGFITSVCPFWKIDSAVLFGMRFGGTNIWCGHGQAQDIHGAGCANSCGTCSGASFVSVVEEDEQRVVSQSGWRSLGAGISWVYEWTMIV